LQKNYEDADTNMSNNQAEIHELEFRISKLESDIVTINLKIPNMEAEKKNYVQNKNFKVTNYHFNLQHLFLFIN